MKLARNRFFLGLVVAAAALYTGIGAFFGCFVRDDFRFLHQAWPNERGVSPVTGLNNGYDYRLYCFDRPWTEIDKEAAPELAAAGYRRKKEDAYGSLWTKGEDLVVGIQRGRAWGDSRDFPGRSEKLVTTVWFGREVDPNEYRAIVRQQFFPGNHR